MSKKKKRVRMEYGLYSLGITEIFQAFGIRMTYQSKMSHNLTAKIKLMEMGKHAARVK